MQPEKTLLPIDVSPDDGVNVTFARLTQFEKTESPIFVTQVGIVIDNKPELVNAFEFIDIDVDNGIVNDVKFEHPWKAPISIVVNEDADMGNIKLLSNVQFWNADIPITCNWVAYVASTCFNVVQFLKAFTDIVVYWLYAILPVIDEYVVKNIFV